MNLYFLVEGDVTEKKLYRAWVPLFFAGMTEVASVQDMTTDCFFVIAGKGIPSYLKRIHASLADIHDNPTAVDHFFVCVDAEDVGHDARFREVQGEIDKALAETKVLKKHPGLDTHVVVQNCCVETWFLGHKEMMRRHPSDHLLRTYQRFFDVREDDPETMPSYQGFVTRAAFHLAYLRAMLAEQNPAQRYTKINPGVVLTQSYLDALRRRVTETADLPSLRRLFDTWAGLLLPSGSTPATST